MNDVTKLSQVSAQEESESVFCSRVVLFIECCKDGVPVGGLYGMEGGCTGRFTSPLLREGFLLPRVLVCYL